MLSSTNNNDTKGCRPDSTTLVDCSGRGTCTCGQCRCQLRGNNEVSIISGAGFVKGIKLIIMFLGHIWKILRMRQLFMRPPQRIAMLWSRTRKMRMRCLRLRAWLVWQGLRLQILVRDVRSARRRRNLFGTRQMYLRTVRVRRRRRGEIFRPLLRQVPGEQCFYIKILWIDGVFNNLIIFRRALVDALNLRNASNVKRTRLVL